MSELRQNLATRDWVVVSPERLKGKKMQVKLNELVDTWPSYSENCPFCPGNEEKYPNVEIERTAETPGKPWDVMCMENKYKIVSSHDSCPIAPAEFQHDGIYNKALGCGNHELVIESPVHNKTFGVMEKEEVVPIIKMYIKRFNFLSKNPNNMIAIIFKNHGKSSGASQQHPHSQIVSMRVVPNHIRHLVEAAQLYFDDEGVCAFCKIIKYELQYKKRIVFENEHFISYTPYASPAPYKVDILPKRHSSHIGQITDNEILALSEILAITMRKLYRNLSNPDFNLVLRNPPFHYCDVPFYHWHIEIAPRIITPGGFEMGSRVIVNVVTPEQAAKELQDTPID